MEDRTTVETLHAGDAAAGWTPSLLVPLDLADAELGHFNPAGTGDNAGACS